MANLDYVIGTPAWDRAWSLPLWFDSVRSNVDPAKTGLVFVVPASDASTREAITKLSDGFRWVEVLRDRGEQLGRQERATQRHATLAAARNQIMGIVNAAQPEHYLSWDSDFIVKTGSVSRMTRLDLPLVTSWSWLNRQPPRLMRYFDGKEYHEVYWQEPIRATAMGWDRRWPGRAVHYPAQEFVQRATGVWKCGVALAFQVMDKRAYSVGSYHPHQDGEDVTFSWQLAQRGIDVWCCGDVQGTHLYDRTAKHEIKLGWPHIMKLAEEYPLAATWSGVRTTEYEAIGFYPKGSDEDVAVAG